MKKNYCLFVFLIMFSLVNAQRDIAVNLVDFGDFSGNYLGTFVQTDLENWVEKDNQLNDQFHYKEVDRDEWSVYLNDASRNVQIRIDLYLKKIMYSDSRNPEPQEQFVIQRNWDSSSNGWIVDFVSYSALDNTGQIIGTFQSSFPKRYPLHSEWIQDTKERDETGRAIIIKYRVVTRDNWSVYLRDDVAGRNVQIDLHTRKIYFTDDGASEKEERLFVYYSKPNTYWFVPQK